jgi:SHS2 domain-containing protein
MKQHQIVEHTADLEIRAQASTLEELFQAVLEGMTEASEPSFLPGRTEVARDFQLEAPDAALLLVDFLNEAIGLADARHEAYGRVRFSVLEPRSARGELYGRPVSRFGVQVKAATYHELALEERNGRFEAKVIFDV